MHYVDAYEDYGDEANDTPPSHWSQTSRAYVSTEPLEDPGPGANSSKNWWGRNWGWLVALALGLVIGGFIWGAIVWTGGEVISGPGTGVCMIIGVAWVCWLVGRWFKRKRQGFMPRRLSMGYVAIPFAVWGWISFIIWVGDAIGWWSTPFS